jgi:hypothetical protein
MFGEGIVLPKLKGLKGEKNLAEWNSLLKLHLAYHGLDNYIRESVDANDATKQRNRIKVMIIIQSSLSSEIRERLIGGGINEYEPDPKAFYDGIIRMIPASSENATQELKFTAFYKHLEHLQSLRRCLEDKEDIDAMKDEAQAGSDDEDTTTNKPAPHHETIPPIKADYAPIRPPLPGLTPEPDASNSSSIPAEKNRVEELLHDYEDQEEEIDGARDRIQACSNGGDSMEDPEKDQEDDEEPLSVQQRGDEVQPLEIERSLPDITSAAPEAQVSCPRRSGQNSNKSAGIYKLATGKTNKNRHALIYLHTIDDAIRRENINSDPKGIG